MPTLRFFGREFETSINTDEMTGKEFRDFMDEVIRCGLREMENHQSIQSQRYVNIDWFEYVTPESIKDSDKRIWMTSWEDWIPMLDAYNSLMDDIQQTYEQMVDAGIPEEDARYILPNACTTNIDKKVNE